jgi:hypothetical protein
MLSSLYQCLLPPEPLPPELLPPELLLPLGLFGGGRTGASVGGWTGALVEGRPPAFPPPEERTGAFDG